MSAATLPLHVERSGNGPPLVLWHGWGMNLRCFDALRTALASEYTLIAVDLPGHGRSPWQPGWRSGDWLHPLLDTIPEGAALLGWSLGGQLALQAAASTLTAGDSGTRIRRLVLFCTTPRFLRSDDWPHGLAPEVVRGFHARLARDAPQVLADFLELELRGDAEAAAHRALLRAALGAHGEPQAEALDAGLALLERHDLRSLAPQLSLPTLIFSGQHDRVTLAAAGAALAAAMPMATHRVLPRAGHAPLLGAREEWLQPLRAFLAEAA